MRVEHIAAWLDGHTDWLGMLTGILAACAVGAWWPSLSSWADVHVGVAAWAQAFGAVAAIIAAIYFSRSDARRREIERQRRAASYAVSFTPALAHIRNYLRRIDESGMAEDYGLSAAILDLGHVIELFTPTDLAEPDKYGDFSSLDVDMAQSVMSVIAVGRDLATYVRPALLGFRQFNSEQRAEYIADMHQRVEHLRQTAEPLQVKLNLVMDAATRDAISA